MPMVASSLAIKNTQRPPLAAAHAAPISRFSRESSLL
jgi:hypothetical protein